MTASPEQERRAVARVVAEHPLAPQPGPQTAFLETTADIAIYGGSAGGGKTYGLLLDPLRWLRNPRVNGFGAVIFRREATQITNEGGLWDEAVRLYSRCGGKPVRSPLHQFQWRRGRVSFSHLNRETDVLNWHGAQIPIIGFDELTHFTKFQFFYMLTRNRSSSGIRPYVRATCNPDADSWVAEFIAWWIDQDTGYPIPERSGVLRYFARIGDEIVWADSVAECCERYSVRPIDVKSVTFIPSKLSDNPALLAKDPSYEANLRAQDYVTRERLLGGNWKVKPSAGLYFPRRCVNIIEAAPVEIGRWVRAWDLAATEKSEANPDPDWSASVKMGRSASGRVVVVHATHDRVGPHHVRQLVNSTAALDGLAALIRLQQDPGQAGKDQLQQYVAMLSGYPVFGRHVTGDKITRALPYAAQWQAGNVDLVRGPWNEAYVAELDAFPDGAHDDWVDASSEAYFALPETATPDYTKGGIQRRRAA